MKRIYRGEESSQRPHERARKIVSQEIRYKIKEEIVIEDEINEEIKT